MSLSWKEIKIFISSSFLDMHAERVCLTEIILPELNKKLKPMHLLLTPIDLRWGVQEEEANKNLETCLRTIDGCHIFLCLLGSRYGTIPMEQNFSITELEIRKIMKVCLKRGIEPLFFFRSSNFLDQLKNPEQKQMYLDYKENGQVNEECFSKLQCLKDYVSKNYTPCTYEGKWNNEARTPENCNPNKSAEWNNKATQGRLERLDSFAERVKEKIMELVVEKFYQTNEEIAPQQRERNMHKAFVNELNSDHVGGDSIKKELTFGVDDGKEQILVVRGRSGIGKSSLLASFCWELYK